MLMTVLATRQRIAELARAFASDVRGWPRAIASAGRRGWRRSADFARRHPVMSWATAGVFTVAAAVTLVPIALVAIHVYGNRSNLPDAGPFVRFEFLSTGHIYDANGHPLIELAREH